MNTVVIGMDFSEPAIIAARWTKAYLVPDADIVLVHAVVPPSVPSFLTDLYPKSADVAAQLRERARARFDTMALNSPSDRQQNRIDEGRADDVLTRVSDEMRASLVVTAVHGERTALWKMLGSTAERLVRRAHTSVFIARGIAERAPKTILAAIDDSSTARDVVSWAAHVARVSGAEVIVLHVGPPIVGDVSSQSGLDVAALERRTREWIETQTRNTPLAGSRSEVVFGQAGFEIEETMARLDADLLFIARHDHAVRGGPFMGSTAEFVIRNGSRAVLFVAGPPPSSPID